jgi:hypothetical protein
VSVLPLMGCGGAKPVLVIPESLKTCADTPATPEAAADDRAVGTYILDLYDAHADCKAKLGAVVNLSSPT